MDELMYSTKRTYYSMNYRYHQKHWKLCMIAVYLLNKTWKHLIPREAWILFIFHVKCEKLLSNGHNMSASHYVPKMETSLYYGYNMANKYCIIFHIVVELYRCITYLLFALDFIDFNKEKLRNIYMIFTSPHSCIASSKWGQHISPQY